MTVSPSGLRRLRCKRLEAVLMDARGWGNYRGQPTSSCDVISGRQEEEEEEEEVQNNKNIDEEVMVNFEFANLKQTEPPAGNS